MPAWLPQEARERDEGLPNAVARPRAFRPRKRNLQEMPGAGRSGRASWGAMRAASAGPRRFVSQSLAARNVSFQTKILQQKKFSPRRPCAANATAQRNSTPGKGAGKGVFMQRSETADENHSLSKPARSHPIKNDQTKRRHWHYDHAIQGVGYERVTPRTGRSVGPYAASLAAAGAHTHHLQDCRCPRMRRGAS